MDADDIQVGIYADASAEDNARTTELARSVPIPGAANGHLYTGKVSASRPSSHYTVRVLPHHPDVRVPAELALILWQR
jgi:starch phosphorylase